MPDIENTRPTTSDVADARDIKVIEISFNE
jgi:hypothetical protein